MRDCRNVDDDDDIQEQSTSSATTTSSAPPAPKKRQTALNVISTNPTRQHESDILVTRYFIATNTPFNAASNKHLAKLVQFLRPGTTVPDRRRIGGELLDEIYASEQTKVKRMVSGSNVTLAIDGWQNYMAKVPPYNEYLFAEGYKKVESEAWWRSGLRLGFSKELVDYASTLANAISSSAGLERCFSTLGLTYGKLRSSLGVEKAGKLAFLFKQLNE